MPKTRTRIYALTFVLTALVIFAVGGQSAHATTAAITTIPDGPVDCGDVVEVRSACAVGGPSEDLSIRGTGDWSFFKRAQPNKPVFHKENHTIGRTKTFNVECDGNYGEDDDSVTVICDSPPPRKQCEDGIDNDGDGKKDHPADPGCDSPTDDDETDTGGPGSDLSMWATPNTIGPNERTTVSWRGTNVRNCVASGGTVGWPGSKADSGDQAFTNVTVTTDFRLDCEKDSGGPISDDTRVTVTSSPPSLEVDLKANDSDGPYTARKGHKVGLSWTVTGTADRCYANGGPWTGAKSRPSGAEMNGPVHTTRTYTIKCEGPGGSEDSDSVEVRSDGIVRECSKPSGGTCGIASAPNRTIVNFGPGWLGSRSSDPHEQLSLSRMLPEGVYDVWLSSYDTHTTQRDCYNSGNCADYCWIQPNERFKVNLQDSLARTLVTTGVTVDLSNYLNRGVWRVNNRLSVPAGVVKMQAEHGFYVANGSENTMRPLCGAFDLVPPPTGTLTADPNPVNVGDSTTLSWNVSNATYCDPTEGQAAWVALNDEPVVGSWVTGPINTSTLFKMRCHGPGGYLDLTEEVTPELFGPITLDFLVEDTSVPHFGETTLRWTTDNAERCTATGDWLTTGSKVVGGDELTGPLSGPVTYSYTLTCNNSDTTVGPTTVTVDARAPVTPPTVDIWANPNPVTFNHPTRLSWNISGDLDTCSASANWLTPVPDFVNNPTGSQLTPNVTDDVTYTLTCDGPEGDSDTDSETVGTDTTARSLTARLEVGIDGGWFSENAVGVAPFSASLRATVGGSATGPITYDFYCDSSQPTPTISRSSTITTLTLADLCPISVISKQQTKVVVTRDSVRASDTVDIFGVKSCVLSDANIGGSLLGMMRESEVRELNLASIIDGITDRL